MDCDVSQSAYKVAWTGNGHLMVFDESTVMALRKSHRIVGALEGTHPLGTLQNKFFGLPLILLPEEAAMLVEMGVIPPNPDPESPTWPTTERQKQLFRLYKDLYAKGYYLTRGLKFGGDYLLYPGEPMRYHSSHVVNLIAHGSTLSPHQIVSLGRLGTGVKKTRVLSSLDPGTDQFTHITVNWSGMN
ncbi:tRNA-splicing endonuclease subunit Sen34 [Coemansia sp. Benny D115]|nr:tRNA-splicing endonuclease subunit Sen34 [Coemansia sp. Benny D115]